MEKCAWLPRSGLRENQPHLILDLSRRTRPRSQLYRVIGGHQQGRVVRRGRPSDAGVCIVFSSVDALRGGSDLSRSGINHLPDTGFRRRAHNTVCTGQALCLSLRTQSSPRAPWPIALPPPLPLQNRLRNCARRRRSIRQRAPWANRASSPCCRVRRCTSAGAARPISRPVTASPIHACAASASATPAWPRCQPPPDSALDRLQGAAIGAQPLTGLAHLRLHGLAVDDRL